MCAQEKGTQWPFPHRAVASILKFPGSLLVSNLSIIPDACLLLPQPSHQQAPQTRPLGCIQAGLHVTYSHLLTRSPPAMPCLPISTLMALESILTTRARQNLLEPEADQAPCSTQPSHGFPKSSQRSMRTCLTSHPPHWPPFHSPLPSDPEQFRDSVLVFRLGGSKVWRYKHTG